MFMQYDVHKVKLHRSGSEIDFQSIMQNCCTAALTYSMTYPICQQKYVINMLDIIMYFDVLKGPNLCYLVYFLIFYPFVSM